METEKVFSYQVWEDGEICPHCGSANIQYSEDIDEGKKTDITWMECLDCERQSEKVEEHYED